MTQAAVTLAGRHATADLSTGRDRRPTQPHRSSLLDLRGVRT